MNEKRPDTVISMSSAVDYSDQSIVSKVILKRPNGQITLFSFDAGEELSEHTTPYDAFITVTDGTAVVSIAGEPNTVNTGESIVLPANIPHAVKALKRFKMMLVMIK
ncbi:MAG: cupin domain-containing protein [Bacteroidota bacterium]